VSVRRRAHEWLECIRNSGREISERSFSDFFGRFFLGFLVNMNAERIRIGSALGSIPMASNHGYEYQIRIILKDGTEELSGWMNNIEQVAQEVIVAHRLEGKTCRLLARNSIRPNCSEREHVLEYPIMNITSPRCIPYNSRYRWTVDSKNRCALDFSASNHTP
jgi:hypothetical protein